PGQNQFYSVSPTTGLATSVSPTSGSIVAGLAGAPGGTIFGLVSNNLVTVNITSNTTTVIGALGLSATGLDILADGRAFVVPTTAGSIHLHSVSLTTGAASPIGSATAINDALVAAGFSTPAPFIVGLGSVGTSVYGVDSNSRSLIQLNPNTGTATVVGGTAGRIGTGTLANGNNRSRYSGFASLTGVDANADGQFEQLIGGVNFFDDDDNPSTPTVRFGGIAIFDTVNGNWELLGDNPGQIYFGMAAIPVPEPTMGLLLVATGLGVLAGRRRGNTTAQNPALK
ncbi:MAG: PEP-CTERM sorting domain-containing protein, partial [Gemmataceae bacterium]